VGLNHRTYVKSHVEAFIPAEPVGLSPTNIREELRANRHMSLIYLVRAYLAARDVQHMVEGAFDRDMGRLQEAK